MSSLATNNGSIEFSKMKGLQQIYGWMLLCMSLYDYNNGHPLVVCQLTFFRQRITVLLQKAACIYSSSVSRFISLLHLASLNVKTCSPRLHKFFFCLEDNFISSPRHVHHRKCVLPQLLYFIGATFVVLSLGFLYRNPQ